MAVEMWVTTGKKYCNLIEREAALEEHRMFPTGQVNRELGSYLVMGRRCTADVACNLSGIQCRWAYTNPTIDRFDIDS
jgi:hypothetical protein